MVNKKIKEGINKVILDLEEIKKLLSLEDKPPVDVTPEQPDEPTPVVPSKTLIVDDAGIINDLYVSDEYDKLVFSKATEVISVKAPEGKIITFENTNSEALNISVSPIVEQKYKFNSAKWMPQGDIVTYKLTSKGWIRHEMDTPTKEDEPDPVEEPINNEDIPDETYEDNTTPIDFGSNINMRDTYGTDFSKLISESKGKFVQVLLKGQFEVNEDLIFTENIKLVFDYGASITFNNSNSKIYSRIEADSNSHIFKILGDKYPKLYPSSCSHISVKWFGVNDNNEDNQPYFQTAIKCSDYVGSFYIPQTEHGKPYIIKNPIDFVSDGNWQEGFINFPKWVIFGDGVSDGASTNQSSSAIYYEGSELSAINIRGSRWLTKLKDFEIRGKNIQPINNVNAGLGNIEYQKRDQWITEGLSVGRHNHYCGISIDGSLRGEATRASAQIQMEGLKITGFVVGLSISPNTSNQADTIDLNKCKFYSNTYQFSVGQDQARAITLTNCWMDTSYTMFTNRKFGKQNGSLFNIVGGQYTTSFKIFDLSGAFGGNSFIQGAYFEACGTIGTLTSTGINSNAIFFQGCDFKLDNNGYDDGVTFVTPFVCIDGGSNITFDSCTFRSLKKYLSLYSSVNGRFTFRGCSFTDIDQIQIDGLSSIINQNRLNISQCTWNNMSLDFNDNPIVKNDKKNVRLYLKQYTKQEGDGSVGSLGVKIIPTQEYKIPDYWAFSPLSSDTEKEFDYKTSEWSRFVVGDYVTALTSGNIDGMLLSFGQIDVPCLQVVKVSEGVVRFKKLAPEVNLSLKNNNWGRPWTINECFIGENLSTGDWFNDDEGFNRIKADGNPVREIVGQVRGR